MAAVDKVVAAVSRSGVRLFQLVGSVPYTRLDGTATTLALWRGHCRQCGNAFTIATPMPVEDSRMSSKAFERVHCDAHKRGAKRCR